MFHPPRSTYSSLRFKTGVWVERIFFGHRQFLQALEGRPNRMKSYETTGKYLHQPEAGGTKCHGESERREEGRRHSSSAL